MKRHAALLPLLLMVALLCGCTVSLHGRETVDGNTVTRTTGTQIQGAARVGNGQLSTSFGSKPPAGAQGAQVTLSKGASAVLLVGLAISGTAEWIGERLRTAMTRNNVQSAGPISHTCSCYGWTPGNSAAADMQ